MTRFMDLHLKPNIERIATSESLIAKSAELGYSLIAVSLQLRIQPDAFSVLRKMAHDHDLEIVTRINLYPRTTTELLRNLRILRRKYEMIAVDCSRKTVARQAAKDRRVDLLMFPATNLVRRHFDVAEARLAGQSSAALEIEMQSILQTDGIVRARYLSSLRREFAISRKFHIPVILSSGAAEAYQLRGPHDIASIAMLFGMEKHSALKAVSLDASTIIERNRRKLNARHVAQGIRVIEGEQ